MYININVRYINKDSIVIRKNKIEQEMVRGVLRRYLIYKGKKTLYKERKEGKR
jgi:hypothetical protein